MVLPLREELEKKKKKRARGDMIGMYEHFHSYDTVTLPQLGSNTTS